MSKHRAICFNLLNSTTQLLSVAQDHLDNERIYSQIMDYVRRNRSLLKTVMELDNDEINYLGDDLEDILFELSLLERSVELENKWLFDFRNGTQSPFPKVDDFKLFNPNLLFKHQTYTKTK